MTSQSYTATIEVANSPSAVFKCIQDVSKWWGGKDLEGPTRAVGDVFTIRHGDVHYSKQEVVQVVPDRRVVMLIPEATLSWLDGDKHEWTDTRLIFQITPSSDRSVLQFTHDGLVPGMECYSRCAQGWDLVIKDWLFHFITNGTPHFS